MRATAGNVADKAGAYRCLCCGRRVFLSDHDVFERCKGCECSIFEPDWRCSESLSDIGVEIVTYEAVEDSSVRQWSIL